jgi:acyl-CoA thioesterase-2
VELLDWLDLERVDRDLFRGRRSAWRREGALYGGLVGAQALMAAARTVPPGRRPHSLHGYFLRPGDPSEPVVFAVDRDRDGRSFSARRVAALQDGQVIWEMACSFHEPVDGPEFARPLPAGLRGPEESALVDVPFHPLLEIRTPDVEGGRAQMPIDRAWVRVIVPLPDDPLVHACLHMYTSDLTTGFAALTIDGVPAAGPSIDHALWFQNVTRADNWVLYANSAEKVGGHRGLYTGTAHDRSGTLVATIAQEMLLRPT